MERSSLARRPRPTRGPDPVLEAPPAETADAGQDVATDPQFRAVRSELREAAAHEEPGTVPDGVPAEQPTSPLEEAQPAEGAAPLEAARLDQGQTPEEGQAPTAAQAALSVPGH